MTTATVSDELCDLDLCDLQSLKNVTSAMTVTPLHSRTSCLSDSLKNETAFNMCDQKEVGNKQMFSSISNLQY